MKALQYCNETVLGVLVPFSFIMGSRKRLKECAQVYDINNNHDRQTGANVSLNVNPWSLLLEAVFTALRCRHLRVATILHSNSFIASTRLGNKLLTTCGTWLAMVQGLSVAGSYNQQFALNSYQCRKKRKTATSATEQALVYFVYNNSCSLLCIANRLAHERIAFTCSLMLKVGYFAVWSYLCQRDNCFKKWIGNEEVSTNS